MPSVEPPPAAHPGAGDLVAAMLAITPEVGPNETAWPGLTAYRFSRPQAPQWAEVRSLALCCVVQGRKRFVVDGREHVCDPFTYLLLTQGMRFEAEIVEARSDEPYLSFVLQIDPAIVSSVLVDMADRPAISPPEPAPRAAPSTAHTGELDRRLRAAVLRLLRSLASEADRRVLAPLFLREITYRLMGAEQVSGLLQAAAIERRNGPVAEVTRYIEEHLSEPLTVADMAGHVLMSPSALTSAFVQATGVGPYQFAKRMRLSRASALLVEGSLNVSEVAREVGYTSLSYFINEFKRQFGATPRTFARSQRDVVAMRLDKATRRMPSESSTLAIEPA